MLKSLAIVTVFGALLLGGPSVAKDQQSEAHAKQNQPAQAQQPVPPTHVIIDPSSATVRVKSEADENKKAAEEKPLPRFIRPEWVIVYITAVYVVISWLTLWAIKRQADLMEGSGAVAEQSAKAAEVSAKAALRGMELAGKSFEVFKDSVEAARVIAKATALSSLAAEETAKAANAQIQMLKSKERARVAVVPVTPVSLRSARISLSQVEIAIQNIGATHALNARASGGAIVVRWEEHPILNEPEGFSLSPMLQANGIPVVVEIDVRNDISVREIDEEQPRLAIYVFGVVEYDDLFGDAHQTAFKYRLGVATRSVRGDGDIDLKMHGIWKPWGTSEDNRST